jgi:ABC-type nitrate/sulfonate/bicarbonate transport system substrate-binding protein
MMNIVATAAKFLMAILQALGWVNNLAERRAGAAQSQLDAQNAEIKRVEAAAAGGSAVGLQPSGEQDPYDRDRQ